MSVSHTFPVLLWRDHQGWWTAALVEANAPAGLGRSAPAALEQLEDYLQWCFREDPHHLQADFLDPQLLQFKVGIRPEYRLHDRRYPCGESFTLRVQAVTGRQEHGLFACSLPVLGLRFYYHEAQALRGLVTHYVQQHLEEIAPRELAWHLPPLEVRLEKMSIVVRERRGPDGPAPVDLPTLKTVAEALGEASLRRQFSAPWQRETQVTDLVRRLNKERASVLLVGEPGCGKTTVLVAAVRELERLKKEELPGVPRSTPRYWLTSAARVIAGMKYLGQWEQRLEEVVGELQRIDGVLCVGNLLELLSQGGRGPADSIAAFLLPYLQRGELRLVAEATPTELDACRRLLPALPDLFQVLALPQLNRQQAIAILEQLAQQRQQATQLELENGVPQLVYQLFHRFLPYEVFPGKASVFFLRLWAQVRQRGEHQLTRTLVLEEFTRSTGLPDLLLRDEVRLSPEEVLAFFRSRIIGQEEACRVAAQLVLTFKAGLNDPGRPIGVFLLCGPTGVGKTELARTLARYLFGHGEEQERLLRLDMSEYAAAGSGQRLLIQPDSQPSPLVQTIRQRPFQVVLFDEIEKAHPEVFDVLLGLLDEGRLTDALGRTATFRSAIILMTSNLGAERREPFGFGGPAQDLYQAEALKFFRPEFFNRLDWVVTFQALESAVIQAITRKELAEISRREGVQKANLQLCWSAELVSHLAQVGFDTRLGARPLQRTIERQVIAPLARWLLSNPGIQGVQLQADLNEVGEVAFSVLR